MRRIAAGLALFLGLAGCGEPTREDFRAAAARDQIHSRLPAKIETATYFINAETLEEKILEPRRPVTGDHVLKTAICIFEDVVVAGQAAGAGALRLEIWTGSVVRTLVIPPGYDIEPSPQDVSQNDSVPPVFFIGKEDTPAVHKVDVVTLDERGLTVGASKAAKAIRNLFEFVYISIRTRATTIRDLRTRCIGIARQDPGALR
jgi:hypothetical protein